VIYSILWWTSLILGIITPLGGLIWLVSHGYKEKFLYIWLPVLSVFWGITWLLSFTPLNVLVYILDCFVFLLAVFLFIHQARSSLNNRAEVSRLKRLTEVRADQVSALSHEIRTPLALIKGSADLLLEGNPGPLTPQQLVFVKTISQNGEHMISLAEDLLVQARIQAGLFRLHLQPVDLKLIIRQAVEQVRFLSEERGQQFITDYPQVMPRIYADNRLILQAINNLLLNASKHTSFNGHIYLSLVDNDQSAVISVTDDGAGMTAEERKKLFKRFASGRPLGDGTGLGLVITKQIIELHGGQIMVDTSLGRGTTVLFTIPHWRSENGQTSSPGS